MIGGTPASTFKLLSPFAHGRMEQTLNVDIGQKDDTFFDGLQGPGPLAMLTGIENEEMSVQDEFMALRAGMHGVVCRIKFGAACLSERQIWTLF